MGAQNDTRILYLDNAATTPIAAEVREAMLPFLDTEFGNPSTRYPLGVRAARAIDSARSSLARIVDVRSEQVTFCAGGTEANNLGVIGQARARAGRGKHILVGPTEHPCVRASALSLVREGFEVEFAKLDEGGHLDLDDYVRRMRADTVLVAQMLVNNEFGSIYPVRKLAALVRQHAPQAALHVDAVQAAGKLELDFPDLGADSIAISAHKLHGPKGAGALICDLSAPVEPILFGGGQESGRRSGTENVAGLVGFGAALELADANLTSTWKHLVQLREAFNSGLESTPNCSLIEAGTKDGILPSIATILIEGIPAEVVLHHLEARGVMVSAGSACQTQKSDISPALFALGFTAEQARSVLRFSFSGSTSLDDVNAAVAHLAHVREQLGAHLS